MTPPAAPEPGFLAVTRLGGRHVRPVRAGAAEHDSGGLVAGALSGCGVTGATTSTVGSVTMAVWGLSTPPPGVGGTLVLSGICRLDGRRAPVAQVGEWLGARSSELTRLLPPFAGAHLDHDGQLTVATDYLGFCQIYVAGGPGWAAVSTSAKALAACGDGGLDREAIAVQSQLGWQLDRRTLFSGVSQLPGGHAVVLGGGAYRTEAYTSIARIPEPVTMEQAVAESVDTLRAHLENLATQDAGEIDLQLTGGQDSRLLLSAIPTSLRTAVTALTIDVDGSEDTRIARLITDTCGMRHHVAPIQQDLSPGPADAFALCLQSAARVEYMADPIALAALSRTEATLPQRIRISGLGGEVARGFYYLGRVGRRPVTRGRSDRLASWRMFANEHSDPAALHPDFRSWAPQLALDEVHRLMVEASEDWFTATDEFYLWQRMQRWAGVTDTAVGRDREIVNPMLDSRFVNLARALPPDDKKNSRYLGRIQVALDPTLARLRLDGRPAPVAFAYPGPRAQAQMATATGQKALKKVRQRLRKGTRPPAGGLAMAPLVVQHWRTEQTLLEPLVSSGVFDPEWLERVTAGDVEPSPATVALMVNLLGAVS